MTFTKQFTERDDPAPNTAGSDGFRRFYYLFIFLRANSSRENTVQGVHAVQQSRRMSSTFLKTVEDSQSFRRSLGYRGYGLWPHHLAGNPICCKNGHGPGQQNAARGQWRQPGREFPVAPIADYFLSRPPRIRREMPKSKNCPPVTWCWCTAKTFICPRRRAWSAAGRIGSGS